MVVAGGGGGDEDHAGREEDHDGGEEVHGGGATVEVGGAGFSVEVSVTGHTVVLMATVTVVRTVLWAGHLVSVGGQLVMVWTLVVQTVLVVHLGG